MPPGGCEETANEPNGNPETALDDPPDETRGIALALAAYAWWGLSPLFWKLLPGIPASTLLLHRITWAVPVFLAAAYAFGQGPGIWRALGNRRDVGWMAVSACLVATNWLVYLVAVSTGRVLHASLGYFLNPLISTIIGALVLGERLTLTQWMAVALAFLGVLWLGVTLGVVPWIGLVLASSFGAYGLVRKQSPVPPLAGSAVEVLLVGPIAALGVLGVTVNEGLPDLGTGLLLSATGVVTAVPLILFAAAVKRIRLSTMGVVQYVAPSLHFGLAVLVFGEDFATDVHLPAFVLIWSGIALFVWSRR